MNQDPIGFAAGDANLYRYVFNQPNRLSDPSGEIVPLLIIGGLAGANIWIWGNNAQAVDDFTNNRPLKAENFPLSVQYGKGLVVSTAAGAGTAFAAPYVASALPAWATTTGAIGLGGCGIYSNSNAAVGDFEEGNYATGAFHMSMAGLSLYGTAQVIRPGLGIPPQGSAMSEWYRFRSQGYFPKQALHLAKPYPEKDMGHHFISRDWFKVGLGSRLPSGFRNAMQESPYNVMRPQGISRGRFYERHSLADATWRGCSLPNGYREGSWSATSFNPYMPGWRHWLDSPVYGMPEQTQGVTIIIVTHSGSMFE